MTPCPDLSQFPEFARDNLSKTLRCQLTIFLVDEASEKALLDTIMMFRMCYAEFPETVPRLPPTPQCGFVVLIKTMWSNSSRLAMLVGVWDGDDLLGFLAQVGRMHREADGTYRGIISHEENYNLPSRHGLP
jgi:hypothetical protein